MRPSSNIYAAASVPVITQSTRQTDLLQSFVVDPQQQPNVPQFLPMIEPSTVGTDLRARGVLTADHLAQFARRTGLLDISTLAAATSRRQP